MHTSVHIIVSVASPWQCNIEEDALLQTLYKGVFSRLLLSRNVFGGQLWFCIWSFRTVLLRQFLKQNSPMHQNCFIILRLDESLTFRSGLYPGMSQELRSVQTVISATQIQWCMKLKCAHCLAVEFKALVLSSKGFRLWNSTSQQVPQCCSCKQGPAMQSSLHRSLCEA